MLDLISFLLISIVLMSFIEYAVHRWLMHDKGLAKRFSSVQSSFERHTLLHHGRFYKNFVGCSDLAAKHVGMDLSPFFNVLGLSPIWGAALFFSVPAGCCLVAVAALHGLVWTAVHREMHEPANRWFAKTRYFKYICEYHRVHHVRPSRNFNAVLPGVDWLMGTHAKC